MQFLGGRKIEFVCLKISTCQLDWLDRSADGLKWHWRTHTQLTTLLHLLTCMRFLFSLGNGNYQLTTFLHLYTTRWMDGSCRLPMPRKLASRHVWTEWKLHVCIYHVSESVTRSTVRYIVSDWPVLVEIWLARSGSCMFSFRSTNKRDRADCPCLGSLQAGTYELSGT